MRKLKRTNQTAQARRYLRREFDLATRYRLEGSRNQGWRECRVRDLSRDGAGVELFDTTGDETLGQRVVLEFEVPPAVYRLVGDVRHTGPGDQGGVRVGLRFEGLSALERDMLDALLGRDKAAPSAQ